MCHQYATVGALMWHVYICVCYKWTAPIKSMKIYCVDMKAWPFLFPRINFIHKSRRLAMNGNLNTKPYAKQSNHTHTLQGTAVLWEQESTTQAIIPSIPEWASKPRWRLCIWEERCYLPPQTSSACTSFREEDVEGKKGRRWHDWSLFRQHAKSAWKCPLSPP